MDYNTEILIPPSPNWYAAHVADLSFSGDCYAYAAHSYVLLIKLCGKIAAQLAGHRGRVTAICFMKNEYLQSFLLSGASDKTLILWDTYSTKPIKVLHGHRSEICAISCVSNSLVNVVSAEKMGSVFLWNINRSGKPLRKIVMNDISCMCSLNGKGKQIAFGRNDGRVCVFDMKSGEEVRETLSLSGEVCDIQCIEWQNSNLVVASSRNGQIKVWMKSESGSYEEVAAFAHKSIVHGEKGRAWVSCSISSKTRPPTLLCSDSKGGVWGWEIGCTNGELFKISCPHSRPIFDLSIVPPSRVENLVLSCSMDRQIACFEYKEKKSREMWTRRGFGGYAYCVDTSQAAKDLIAVGCGDNTIRLYEEKFQESIVQETHFIWDGITSKVIKVQFHPFHENILGFLTESGTVGIYNIASERMVQIPSSKAKIKDIKWISSYFDPGENNTCMFCSLDVDGLLCRWHNDIWQWENMEKSKLWKAISVCEKRDDAVGEFAFSPCGHYAAFATKLGEIYILSQGMDPKNIVYRSTFTEKTVTALAVYCFENKEASQYLILVLGDTKGTVAIQVLLKEVNGQLTNTYSEEWNKHKGSILQITFSPLTLHFASCSSDNVIWIWSMTPLEASPLTCLEGHHASVLSVAWSLLNPLTCYSVSEDQTMHKWELDIDNIT